VDAPGPRVKISLASGKQIISDVALHSIGRTGATDKLNLGAAGVEVDDRGRLKVNAQFQTNVPHVYAVGDVIGFPALASTSAEQGRVAACHMFGSNAKEALARLPRRARACRNCFPTASTPSPRSPWWD
jgi:NAD(P) transhydrogenase